MSKFVTLREMHNNILFVVSSLFVSMAFVSYLMTLMNIPPASETNMLFQILVFVGATGLTLIFTFFSSLVLYLIYGLLKGLIRVIRLGLKK